ncbi:MAG: hypothetical protein ACRC1K_12245, partial [Planctomycetia bacterium]
ALSVLGQADEPTAGLPIAPRQDLYTTFTESYLHPETCAPADQAPAQQESLWNLRSGIRPYVGTDYLNWRRSKPGNKELVRTSPNIFPPNPVAGVAPLVVAPLLGGVESFFPASTTQDPNDPGLRINVPVNTRLNANETLMQTDDFNMGTSSGLRFTVGALLPNGDRIEGSYFYVQDFESELLTDLTPPGNDPLETGPAFFTRVLTSGNTLGTGAPPRFAYQRMGYLNSPFTTTDPRFSGEQRRQLNGTLANNAIVNAVLFPHYPGNENPVIPGPDVITSPAPAGYDSRAVPREPTVNDPLGQGLSSLLWTDGELALASYSFDVQGGEVLYKRRIFEHYSKNWELTFLGGMRYVGMDEGFDFLFADTTYDRALASRQTSLRTPPSFDPRDPNNALVEATRVPPPGGPIQNTGGTAAQGFAQTAEEVRATYQVSVDNDIIGPELGLDARLPFLHCFELSLMGKGTYGINFLTTQSSVVRGDGLTLFNYENSGHAGSGIFEGHVGLNCYPHPRIRLHGGWEWMWLSNVANGIDQINFNLQKRPRPNSKHGILFDGWYTGCEITF